MTYIYALSDPRDNQIMYIGKSNNPERRLTEHMTSAIPTAEQIDTYGCVANNTSPKTTWLAELRTLNKKPELIILEECEDGEWGHREMFWYMHCILVGYPLFNKVYMIGVGK